MQGDQRWLDVSLELDCLDVHFYSDGDPRWSERTRFHEFINDHGFETTTYLINRNDKNRTTSSGAKAQFCLALMSELKLRPPAQAFMR